MILAVRITSLPLPRAFILALPTISSGADVEFSYPSGPHREQRFHHFSQKYTRLGEIKKRATAEQFQVPVPGFAGDSLLYPENYHPKSLYRKKLFFLLPSNYQTLGLVLRLVLESSAAASNAESEAFFFFLLFCTFAS